MANLEIQNNALGNVYFKDGVYRDETLTLAAADTILEGTILARRSVATAVVAAADVGNTGDGTVTSPAVVAGPVPIVGAYNLECIDVAVAEGTATATAAADGGNTGDGTVTSLTVTADRVGLEPGAYNLEMTELGVKNGTATATAAADGGNTGDGAAGAATAGSAAKAGVYTLTCITAQVDAGIFSVFDPDGERLEDLTVAVAYSNNHFGITIADGATDFIVGDIFTITMTNTGGLFKLVDPSGSVLQDGIVMDAGALAATVVEVEGITFTITDGATDFVVGDKFAITVADTVGTWKLVDPNGMLVSNTIKTAAGASQATTIEIGSLTFIVTDGATDFVVGDKFSLTVAADGNLVPYATAGVGGAQIPIEVLTYELVTTAGGDFPVRPMVSGEVKKERLVIDGSAAGVGITDAILDQLRDYGIVATDFTELNKLDNQ